jgi:hypothetical protein
LLGSTDKEDLGTLYFVCAAMLTPAAVQSDL